MTVVMLGSDIFGWELLVKHKNVSDYSEINLLVKK